MNDFWLFIGFLVFLFVIWFYSGGPNKPISFAGPYITAVTAPGVAQVGYGPGANNSAYISGGSAISSGSLPADARSPYAGEVGFSYSEPTASDERAEYIHLHLDTNDEVDVTGWQLVGAARGIRVVIPQGQRGTSSSKRDITLDDDYRDAYIVTGSRATDSVKDQYQKEWHAFLGDDDDIWQNGSDTITLLDQNGKVVDQYKY